jgi:hypothetical protein
MDCPTLEIDPLADVNFFAAAFAELAAPPAVRHQAERSAAMIAALASPPRRLIRELKDCHEALARRSGGDAASRQ